MIAMQSTLEKPRLNKAQAFGWQKWSWASQYLRQRNTSDYIIQL